MTREEAIKWLIKPARTSTDIGEIKAKEIEAYNVAIEALSAKDEQTIRHIENNTKESELVYRPSAEAVQGYTEWLEKQIVDTETYEWICDDTPDPEWCENNCHYSSIQAECLRHVYEMSKGGDAE